MIVRPLLADPPPTIVANDLFHGFMTSGKPKPFQPVLRQLGQVARRLFNNPAFESTGVIVETRSGMGLTSMSTGSAEDRIRWPQRWIFEQTLAENGGPDWAECPDLQNLPGQAQHRPQGKSRGNPLACELQAHWLRRDSIYKPRRVFVKTRVHFNYFRLHKWAALN